MRSRDGKCEDRLNNIHCNYDYGDCCLPVVDLVLCDDCICAEDGLVHRSRDCKLNTTQDIFKNFCIKPCLTKSIVAKY